MKTAVNTKIIRAARLTKGYSQAELASKAGIAWLTVNQLESDKTIRPHPKTIKSICEVLGLGILEVYQL